MREEQPSRAWRYCRVTAGIRTVMIMVGVMGMMVDGRGEDIRKQTLTSADAARKQEQRSKYNFRIGPVRLRTDFSSAMEFNDNINLQPYDSSARQSDFIFRPGFMLDVVWPATDLNELTFTLGASYVKYVSHPELDINKILITPDSVLEFTMYVQDWKIKFSDRFSYQTDPVAVPELSGRASFERFTNDFQVKGDWDLNQVIVSIGVGNSLLIPFQKEFEAVERQTNSLTIAPKFMVTPSVAVGLNNSVAATDYVKNIQPDGINYQTGPFVEAAITDLTKVRVETGYQMFDFQSGEGGGSGGKSDYSSFYGSLAAENRLNQYFDHQIKMTRQADLAIGTNYSEKTLFDYGVNWRCLNHMKLQTGFFYELAETSARLPEESDRFGFKTRVGNQLTKSVTLGLDYRLTMKESNLVDADYLQNIATVTVSYGF